MTERKFYRTIVKVEVLSEAPIDSDLLEYLPSLHSLISTCDCSGQVSAEDPQELNGKEAADALISQASEPGFFRLTEEGEDSQL